MDVLALLVFCLAATFASRWLAARLHRRQFLRPGWPWTLPADLLWTAVLFGGALLARRYIERVDQRALGYFVAALLAFGLSLLRAWLYQGLLDRRPGRLEPHWDEILRSGVHNLVYLLFASALYLLGAWLAGGFVVPGLFVPLALGALLPDIDSQRSLLGRLLPFFSRQLEARLGTCQEWHSLGANAIVAAVTAPLIILFGITAWALLSLGFLSHLLVDLFRPDGVPLFWPVSRRRRTISAGVLGLPGSRAEQRLVLALGIVALFLLLVVDVGRPAPPPAPQPSFEQSLARYRSLQGRTLAFADVDGVWQATGRRVQARFEILNAQGQSLILLDNYTGRVFTAGKEATDNLYLDHVAVVQGSGANVKPVEIRLDGQLLARALPVLYEMQGEPGLKYIFCSGDVVLSNEAAHRLQADYAQTEVRRIVDLGGGHYRLRYLTASDLIALGDVPVESADLVIVATYASPPTGPTATPLPEPPQEPPFVENGP